MKEGNISFFFFSANGLMFNREAAYTLMWPIRGNTVVCSLFYIKPPNQYSNFVPF